MIVRCVDRNKRECRNDTAEIAKADHPSRPQRPFELVSQVHDIPTYGDWQRSENTHRHQKDSRILHVNIVVDIQ